MLLGSELGEFLKHAQCCLMRAGRYNLDHRALLFGQLGDVRRDLRLSLRDCGSGLCFSVDAGVQGLGFPLRLRVVMHV